MAGYLDGLEHPVAPRGKKKMKIQKIEAENFKLFTKRFHDIQDMETADVVLLNGPNGYGKTSVFDIVEFCLTGKIKRIKKYSEELEIAKNEVFDNKILIADKKKPAYVKVYFEDNGRNVEIGYFYTPPKNAKKAASKENNPHKIFECFERKILCDGNEIGMQDSFLKSLRINDTEEVFDKCCFLSQDEHLQFLKEAKKSKVKSLSFLFEIPEEWETEDKRIEGLLETLSNTRKRNDKSYLKRLDEKEIELQNQIKNLENCVTEIDDGMVAKGQIAYQKIFDSKSILWDQEKVSFDAETYKKSQKEIEDLLYFSDHREECETFLFNAPYKDLITPFDGSWEIVCDEHLLEFSFRFYSLLKQENELEERYLKEKKYRVALKSVEERKYEVINWDFIRDESLLEEAEIKQIKEQINIMQTLKTTMGILAKTLKALQDTRTSLVKYTDAMIQHEAIGDSVCPLCGASYTDRDELRKQIGEETKVLDALSDTSAIRMKNIAEKLYTDYFEKIEAEIQRKLKNTISDELYQKLLEVKKNRLKILNTEHLLNQMGLYLPETYQDESEIIKSGYTILLEKLEGNLREIEDEVKLQLIDRRFEEAFDRFYDKDKTKFLAVSSDLLNQKREHVKSIYYNFNKKELVEKNSELKKIQNRKKQLENIINEMEQYQKALEEGVQAYKKKIICDIEPLLYVYTAKILQQKFNGKSIFISTDDQIQNIQLVNSLADGQDILYSMSSGQLSAVALSFLLCMNRVYGKQSICSLLLIDDPVQTIDDVNMVGFVDLLRYEFADRQIFISTHEQKFEWFLRYRYAKADKKVKIFNMKDLMLEENI